MLRSIRRKWGALKTSTSGNAALLVALGMPALIGGSGLAVDTAQWYLWKREIQQAADQAALAGAWALSHEDSRASFVKRIQQEFAANLQATGTIATVPTVKVLDYNGGDDNSVMVSASASRRLPFSGFITGDAATVSVYAHASFTDGKKITACLIATDEDDSGAITIGGSTILTAACGLAALSTSDSAVIVNGNPTLDPGWVYSAGGIDDWLSQHTDSEIHEYVKGLYDPFASLNAPVPRPNESRTYNCVSATVTTTGDRRTRVDTLYTYWKGSNADSAVPITYSGSGYLPDLSGEWTDWSVGVTLPTNTTSGLTVTDGTPTWTSLSGSGQNRIWRKRVYRTHTEIANAATVGTNTQATLSQGTYRGGFDVSCTTVFSPGIYVIDGGRVKITGQHQVTGAGIMLVLKNGAYLDITGGSNIALTAATAAQLSYVGGLSASEAEQLSGMLVFEDRDSPGSDGRNVINGNAATVLNGKIYLPKSDLRFSGTATVTSACLLIAAARITLEGNTNMTSFCPSGIKHVDSVTSGRAIIKLVA